MNLQRIFNTIRHLKPVQIYGRVTYLVKRKLLTTGQSAALSKLAQEHKQQLPVNDKEQIELTFLNHQRCFALNRVLWQSQDFSEPPEKLWIYHLNYFTWLFDEQSDIYSQRNLYLILDWIEKNNSSRSETWEPYPTSIRLCNWVSWSRKHPSLPEIFADCIWQSIANQCDRLFLDLEFHNQANHLLENLRAIFMATTHLADWNEDLEPAHDLRLQYCADQLNNEIRTQFFADGGHFERSPMYHREMVNAVSDIKKTCRFIIDSKIGSATLHRLVSKLAQLCEEKLPLMRDWLAVMTHPDGKIAQFNDSALVEGVKREKHSERPLNYLLEDSGFFVRLSPDSYFALSCAEPSPPFQPGHSHCDILSYELSLNGSRCIIDTGCGSYQNGQIRKTCRESAAHNLPFIENTNQSDIWENFRIGRRARVTHRHFDPEKGLLEIEFVDQYEQRFRREVVFAPNSIRFRDRMFDRRVTGTFCSLLHLSPEVLIQPEKEPGCSCFSIGTCEFSIRSSARLRIDSFVWYPDFGTPVNAVKLILSNHEAEAIDYVITWQTS